MLETYIDQLTSLGLNNRDEYSKIAGRVYQRRPCNLLVFGVGYDSVTWLNINSGGETIFIEDNIHWMNVVRENLPDIEIIHYTYPTVHSQWKLLLDQKDKLLMNLPKWMFEIDWDVIFVDGPSGTGPGRMQSIYTTSVLAKEKTDIFVHDYHRQIETAYCDKYLGNMNDRVVVNGHSRLACYSS
ncbi:MAG: hypothetical protein WC942_08345 [Clostridia bacterium]|jgi:glucuronoxylan 4-O-methyltransferase